MGRTPVSSLKARHEIYFLTLNHLKAFCFCRALKNFDPIAKEVNSAVLAINDVINYFNVRDKSLEVKPGNEVKIIIRPSKQNSTTSFAGLGLDSEKENLNFIVKKNSELFFFLVTLRSQHLIRSLSKST